MQLRATKVRAAHAIYLGRKALRKCVKQEQNTHLQTPFLGFVSLDFLAALA